MLPDIRAHAAVPKRSRLTAQSPSIKGAALPLPFFVAEL